MIVVGRFGAPRILVGASSQDVEQLESGATLELDVPFVWGGVTLPMFASAEPVATQSVSTGQVCVRLDHADLGALRRGGGVAS